MDIELLFSILRCGASLLFLGVSLGYLISVLR